jgi:hypothetical protein
MPPSVRTGPRSVRCVTKWNPRAVVVVVLMGAGVAWSIAQTADRASEGRGEGALQPAVAALKAIEAPFGLEDCTSGRAGADLCWQGEDTVPEVAGRARTVLADAGMQDLDARCGVSGQIPVCQLAGRLEGVLVDVVVVGEKGLARVRATAVEAVPEDLLTGSSPVPVP